MDTQMYSSISRRIGAFVIDSFILGGIGFIAGHIIPFLGAAIAWFFYGPILESSEIRATIGKQLMGIQVVDLTGRRLTFKAALLRNFMKLFSTAFMLLGCVIAFFTARKQAAHDLLADSVVVYGRSETPVVDAWIEHSKEILRMRDSDSRPAAATSAHESVTSQLERLQSLFEKGSLTAEEFDAAKKRILN